MSEPVALDDFEEKAKLTLTKGVFEYYKGGSGDEVTLRENRKSFRRYYLLPRMLRAVASRDLSTTMLGRDVSMPIAIAPTAMQKMAHEDGERATVRAAARSGVCMVLSTASTCTLEDVATSVQALPPTVTGGKRLAPRWFQLYVYCDRPLTEEMIRRVERSGYEALVLTVDTPICGLRWADMRNKFAMPPHLSMANFIHIDGSPIISAHEGKRMGFMEYANQLFDRNMSWSETLPWLRSITSLPIVVKGVLVPEDAALAMQYGASGIVVSNHGARQLDGVPATLDALPHIVNAVRGSSCEVYMDGGVRTGSDVLKALALGARAVFIGRPVVYGLAYGGEDGVVKVLDFLRRELDVAMALAGVRNVSEIDGSLVVGKHDYLRSKL